MAYGHSDRNIRLGVVKEVSSDKGPHKLMIIECDGKEMECKVGEVFGMQSVPHKDAECIVIIPDGDESKAIAYAHPRPKDRVDGQKEGEVTLKNHDTGNRIQHAENGDTLHDAKKDIIMKSGGIVHINP